MYTQTITRQNRGAILIAIDCSLSMSERINFNNLNISKAEAVALICNYILDELLALATRGREVRNYYDIAVLGYHDDVVESMLCSHRHPRDILSPAQKHIIRPISLQPTRGRCYLHAAPLDNAADVGHDTHVQGLVAHRGVG